jgi:3',5'-cyclic AMP phosphodiesterase CpdA
MKIVHISDLHFPTKVPVLSLRWKMFTGYFNYFLRRRKSYPNQLFQSLVKTIQSIPYDLLIISGDITNVSHELEFKKARELLDPILNEKTFMIPGNHDRYMKSAIEPEDYFQKYFGEFLGDKIGENKYLRIKTKSDIPVIGWDSNFPSGIGNASGRVDEEVINSTFSYLRKNSISKYLLVCHHPLWNPIGYEESSHHKMINREDVIRKLMEFPPLIYFHGHKHSNFYKKLDTAIPFSIINSASSTMLPRGRHKSGFHIIDIAPEKLIVQRYAYNDMTFVETDTIEY